MKWPAQLVIIRHAESQYNILKGLKLKDPLYGRFLEAYGRDYRSSEARELAGEVRKKYALDASDAKTGLTPEGKSKALEMGTVLGSKLIHTPHVIFVSPYVRTVETLEYIKLGWPALKDAKIIPDDRIREQEHGLALLYNDRRVFHVFHPEQKELLNLQGPYWYRFPQGESVSQVRDRLRSFLATLIREYSNYRVMLITHHITILSIRATLERLSPQEFIRLDKEEKPLNCGLTIYMGNPWVGREGRLELQQYNKQLY